jgi:cytochrome c-type biogenesis protein CcsB
MSCLAATIALAGLDLTQWQALLNTLAFAICLGAMLFYWGGAAFPQVPLLAELGLAGMVGANLTIAALLTARWIDAGYFPLSNLYESLFFLAWGITALHLVALQWTRRRWVGVMTAPLATGIVAFAALALPEDMQAAQPLVPALQSNWLMMHVSVMLLAYAALLVGSLLAMAFLILTRGQEVQLKGNSLGLQFRPSQAAVQPELIARARTELPPQPTPEEIPRQQLSLAEILDNASYRFIGLGFPLLTIGIIAGAVWGQRGLGYLLELGSQGNLGLDYLVGFCCLSTRPHHQGLAGQASCASSQLGFWGGLGLLPGSELFGQRLTQLRLVLLGPPPH